MKKTAVFIVENSYQQFYAELLSVFLKKNNFDIYVYFFGFRSDFFLESSSEIESIFYDKTGGKSFTNFYEERKTARIIAKRILDYKINVFFVFKDHSFLQSYIIRKLISKNVRSVLIEEGLSLYTVKGNGFLKASGLKRLLKYRVRQFYYLILGAGLVIEEFGCNKNLSSVLAFDPDLIPSEKKIKNIVKLPIKIPFKELSNSKLFEDFSNEENILFFISPFLYLAKREKDKHIKKIQNIINSIVSLGFKCILKIHPLETKEQYSNLKGEIVFINNDTVAIEALYAKIKPIAVISEGSSASVNFSRFFNVKSIVLLSDFLMDGFFKDTKNALDVLNRYCDVVYSENEMFEILKKLAIKTHFKQDLNSSEFLLDSKYSMLINKIN